MANNEYLSSALSALLVLIPIWLVSVKLSYPKIPWWGLVCSSLILNWVVTNFMMWVTPPNNGFASYCSLLFGWFYMLPFFTLTALISLSMKQFRGISAVKWVSLTLFFTILQLPIYAASMRISEEDARELATMELQKRGLPSNPITKVEKTPQGWVVYVSLPKQKNYPVYLSRSGFVTGVDG